MTQPGDAELQRQIAAVKRVMVKVPRKVGDTAVMFTKERFRRQAWLDHRSKRWKKRKPGSRRNKGRAILVDKARLKRSIRVKRAASSSVTIGSNVPYAKAHNEGVRGTVSVKAHSRNVNNKKVTVGAHTKKMNLPKRQFMGKSQYLDKRIKRVIASQILKALKQ